MAKKSGREILRWVRNPEGCLRHLRAKAIEFFNLDMDTMDLKEVRTMKPVVIVGAGILDPDLSLSSKNLVSVGDGFGATSS